MPEETSKNQAERSRIAGIAGKPFEWVGRGVLLLLQGLRVLAMGFRVTFQTKRGRTRWSFVIVLVLFVLTSLYNYPRYYNEAVAKVNPTLTRLSEQSYPSGFGWVGDVLRAGLPAFPERDFHLGLDLIGGTQLLYDADTSKIPEEERAAALEGVRDVIERRVNAFGVAEPVVQTDRSGDQWRVLVELAGVDNVSAAIAEIGETPLLEFKEQDAEAPAPELSSEQRAAIAASDVEAKAAAVAIIGELQGGADFAMLAEEHSDDPGSAADGGELGFVSREVLVESFATALFDELTVGELTVEPVRSVFGYHIIEKLEERTTEEGNTEARARHILLRVLSAEDFLAADASAGWKNTQLSGKHLGTASVVFDPQTNQPQVQLTFDSEGSALFEEITGRNVGQPVGIFLDGQPLSIPTVQQAIVGGQAVITGSFTINEAKLLAQRLNAGALPVPITLVSQQLVGASLGAVAIAESLQAALVGFLLVAIFMIAYYRLPGFLAVVALLVYASFVLAVFKLWPVTLTLAGVTGFILSIGMAVDANILIFERLREELRKGRSLSSAVDVGFTRAWTSIRDSNASSLITCAILYWFGTSVVRGFALTLAIGIGLSMLTAIYVTRTFLRLAVGEGARFSTAWFGVSLGSVEKQT